MREFFSSELVPENRIVRISPEYVEVLGTDRFEDTNKTLGKEFELYRDNWREYPKKMLVSDFPLHLDVECTNTCNLRCEMCQIPFGSMKPGFMDMALYEKILEEIKRNAFRLPSIKFNFRGEPLLHPQIAEFTAKARQAGILDVQFNTNGSRLTEELSEKLIKAGLVRIKFSVDNIDENTYNKIRKGADYRTTVSNIEKFLNIRDNLGLKLPSVTVQMVYMACNEPDISKYIGFWEDKVNRIGFSRYRSDSNEMGEKGSVSKEKSKRIPCAQLWQRLVVLWDGTVLMCCGDHQMKNPVGDINKESIYDIWHGNIMDSMRQLHKEYRFDEIDACRHCQVNYL